MESGRFAPDTYDVQGLPYQSKYEDADGLTVGGRGGLSWRSASFDFAYSRRDYWQPDSDGQETAVIGEERLGVAMAGVVAAGFNVSAQAAYNRVLDVPDDVRAQFALRLPGNSVFSAGIEHRLPWFDSSSIFNVFGAQPRQGAYTTYQLPVEALNTEFEARGWTRLYHGDLDPFDWGAGESDELAYGGALGHDSRLTPWGYLLQFRSLLSAQSSVEASYGGDQVLVDSMLKGQTPGFRSLGLTLRGVMLWANSSTWRYGESTAVALVTGVDLPTEIGEFNLMVEWGTSSQFGQNSKAYVVYEVEAWP